MLWKHTSVSVSHTAFALEDYKQLQKLQDETITALDKMAMNGVKIGSIELLEWAHKNGVNFTWRHFSKVGHHGHNSALEWADAVNLEWLGHSLFSSAAVSGRAHTFEWAKGSRHGHRLSSSIATGAKPCAA